MKPPPFDYLAAGSVDEALSALGDSEDAKLLAGGQSLVPVLSFRLTQPELLVDLRKVEELGGIRDGGDRVEIGAMVTQAEAEESTILATRSPLIGKALEYVAHPQIRSRGTIGGSLAHADPAAELPAALLALDGSVQVAGPTGRRKIAADDLFVTMLTTSLAEDEILIAIELPAVGPGTGSACVEIARRRGDYAICGVVVQAGLDQGVVNAARVAYFGISDRPVRAVEIEQAILGANRTEAPGIAAEAAGDTLQVKGDPAISESYRRQLAGVVVKRALDQALEMAA